MFVSKPRQKFEITIPARDCKFKHVCAALGEDEAIRRVMEPYKSRSPVLVNVKRLGCLPAKLKR